MEPVTNPDAPLAHVALGDVVVLPDGRAMTTRCRVSLPLPVGSMAGFIIAGEMEVLLSTPARADAPVLVYVPIDELPFDPAQCRTAAEGAASYWAPHLPALRGAMGEILWRVVEVRGQVDPVVIVYRGPETIVFIRASYAWSSDLRVLYMRRDTANDVDVDRHAATVAEPASDPLVVPDHEPSLFEAFTRVARQPA